MKWRMKCQACVLMIRSLWLKLEWSSFRNIGTKASCQLKSSRKSWQKAWRLIDHIRHQEDCFLTKLLTNLTNKQGKKFSDDSSSFRWWTQPSAVFKSVSSLQGDEGFQVKTSDFCACSVYERSAVFPRISTTQMRITFRYSASHISASHTLQNPRQPYW